MMQLECMCLANEAQDAALAGAAPAVPFASLWSVPGSAQPAFRQHSYERFLHSTAWQCASGL
jgi:hypothetical protein